MCSDGTHRGGYEHPKDDRVYVLAQYLQNHKGIRITRATIRRETKLTKAQLERAIETLSFTDPHMSEDDHGNLFYLP